MVDAQSDEDTVAIAEAGGASVISTQQRGRARQMNLGAEHSKGEILLFVHGDTSVPHKALRYLRDACEDRGLLGGGFSRRFDSPSRWLSFTAWCADFRGRWWGLFLGDQGQFVRREVFEELGGFDEAVAVGEDLDFSFRLARRGKTRLIVPPILSSARRFEKHGPWRQTWMDFRAARAILQASRIRLSS